MAKNWHRVKLKGSEILGKKVLILGEAGSGKTKLLAELLQELINLANPEEITVIDFAPERVDGIGGKIADYISLHKRIHSLLPERVYTPRLAGDSPEQVLDYAELNRKNMEPLLNSFLKEVTPILVINDLTLYLHLGEIEIILECSRLANTFLATAYYGSRLNNDLGTKISTRERLLTDKLAASMDYVVKID